MWNFKSTRKNSSFQYLQHSSKFALFSIKLKFRINFKEKRKLMHELVLTKFLYDIFFLWQALLFCVNKADYMIVLDGINARNISGSFLNHFPEPVRKLKNSNLLAVNDTAAEKKTLKHRKLSQRYVEIL